MAYRNVLVCLDLRSGEAYRLIDRALSMAEGPREITILHVIEVGTHNEERDTLASSIEEAFSSRSVHLADICRAAGMAEGQHRILVGRASSEIAAFANEQGYDLVVLGEHGASGWRPLLGSTTYKTLNLLSCDVLVVRTGRSSGAQDSSKGH